VHWTNAVASVAILILGVYLWRHASDQAEDEATLFGGGTRWTGFRVLSLKTSAVFLAIMGFALFAAGFR
jgi:hypothetical protein